jgi:hypothetical protein
MAAMYEALIGLAEMSRILARANFICHHEAAIALGHQKPSMVEARSRARCVAVPTETSVRHVLVGPYSQSNSPKVFQRQVVPSPTAEKCDIFGVRVPQRPLSGVDNVAPDLLARSLDDEFVAREQVRTLRIKALRPVDLPRTCCEVHECAARTRGPYSQSTVQKCSSGRTGSCSRSTCPIAVMSSSKAAISSGKTRRMPMPLSSPTDSEVVAGRFEGRGVECSHRAFSFRTSGGTGGAYP